MNRDGHALTKKFLFDLRDPGVNLLRVAELYASLRLQNSPPHWPTVNDAIREQFSARSLTRVKNMADKIVERCR